MSYTSSPHLKPFIFISILLFPYSKVRALWTVTALKEEKGGRSGPVKDPEVYNLVDKSESDQGSINVHIKKMFSIETGFQGTMISQFAKVGRWMTEWGVWYFVCLEWENE